ncbi:MAG: gliding motility-associated C-terminal domain-containing protein [Crocinitomix sp.]|nr:gliding motility-associated C-terminal domain-containing protein [Crocinitomix sp.]
MLKSSFIKLFFFFAVIFGAAFPSFSQLVFDEAFDEAEDATTGTDDLGGITWVTDCPECIDEGDFFKVQGDQLVGQDTNGPATVESEVIDISDCDFIEIEFDLFEEGTMEACGTGCNSVDYVRLEYNIDGAGWVDPADATFCAGACADVLVIQSDDIDGGFMHYSTGCIDGGSELQLRITVQAWAASERWIIDDLQVSCSDGPELDAGDDVVVCEGTFIVLEADNPGGADLSWSDGVIDGVGFEQDPGTVIYTVTATSGECTATDEISVTVVAAEAAFVDPAGPYLITDPTEVLTGTPDGGTWSADCIGCIDPVSGEFDPGAAGVGTWTICYEVGVDPCIDENCITILVTSGECLLDGIITSNPPTCFGFSDGSVTINVTDATGDITFVITNEDGTVINEDNSNTANSLSEDWYYFNVSDEFPCEIIDSVFINDPDQMTFDLVISHPQCYGDESGFTFVENVENATGDPTVVSYFWTPNPSGDNGIGEDSLLNVGAGEYNITINDENGCSVSEIFELIYPDSLFFSEFGSFPAYCRLFGYQSGNGVVFASGAGGVGDFGYLWENLDNGETTDNTTWGGLNPGNYRITMTDDNDCQLSQDIRLDSLNPIANFELTSEGFSADWEGNSPLDVNFVNTSENFANPNNPSADTNFIWNFGIGGNVLSDDLSETFDLTFNPGQYEVCLTVVNKNGCRDSLCRLIEVFEPFAFESVNIFTPNNDGINDGFTFQNYAHSVESFECIILNRWGSVVAEFNSITDVWNGDLQNGTAANAGVYFYKYSGETFLSESFKGQGTIQLLR